MRRSTDRYLARHAADMGPVTTLGELLRRMPNIGEDREFERPRGDVAPALGIFDGLYEPDHLEKLRADERG